MRILGVDPGLTATGYGVIEVKGSEHTVLESGTIRPPRSRDLGVRLASIYRELRTVIKRCQPDESAFEEIFVAKNVLATLRLGHARGAAILAAAQSDVPVYEYSALKVKKSVVGYGRAEKSQMQKMLPSLLTMKDQPDSPDAADALAVAWCHSGYIARTARFRKKL